MPAPAENWSERLGGGFSASPVYAEDRVYFTNEEGTTYVVRAGTKYELVATNDLGERSLASPAVDNGAIYLRTASHLWRIVVSSTRRLGRDPEQVLPAADQ